MKFHIAYIFRIYNILKFVLLFVIEMAHETSKAVQNITALANQFPDLKANTQYGKFLEAISESFEKREKEAQAKREEKIKQEREVANNESVKTPLIRVESFVFENSTLYSLYVKIYI